MKNQAYSQTWGQVHEYLYLSTFKYRFESTCTLLKYFLNFPNVLVLILKYFAKYLYVLEYLKYFLSTANIVRSLYTEGVQ